MSIASKVCSEDDCNKRVVARGLCAAHYYHFQKAHPEAIRHPSKPIELHGMVSTPEYSTWSDIKKRTTITTRADYINYGARGIKVCERWMKSFVAFFEDMGPRPSPKHSIDRIDVNGDYEPGNCRWVTRDVQALNRRIQKNNKSGVVGVRKNNQTAKWYADIRHNHELIYLGSFASKQDAILARKAAELKYFAPILAKNQES